MQYAKVSRSIGGRELSFETGKIARQAQGSVMAQYGDTVVLCTACHGTPRAGLDFFPLSVEYREKTYAAGKFPGGFIKREGRPKDKEILTCRLIDRPVRPLWPDGYKDEIQIIATVVSADPVIDPDVVAMNGCFAALHASELPFHGPLAAVRVGRLDGEWIAFPTPSEVDDGDVEIIVAGTRDAIMMVEGEAQEISEAEFLSALDFANDVLQTLLDMMDELREKAGIADVEWKAVEVTRPPIYDKAIKASSRKLKKAVMTQGKHARYAALKVLRNEIIAELVPPDAEDAEFLTTWIKQALGDAETALIRRMILKDGKRIDNRGLKDIRPITCEVGLLPRTHGSALFTRGETQALVVVTLGTPRDQQIVDGLLDEYAKRLDLQYNFPPFCVGETKPIRGVSRRELGHGALAERAVSKIVPSEDRFPYTIRVVSEVTESNGSSSMATVCGSTLALMDAGVTITQPVAGIAMGLISDGKKVAVLSDILGTEDHIGDMDFKVAGTGRGITAVQMDIKIKGLSREIMAEALEQAREGRIHILREMIEAIRRPREELSRFAPRLIRIKIPVDKIGLIIGPGGNHIKKLQEETGAKVEIDDDGTVIISAVNGEGGEAARARIEAVTAEVEVGRVYDGRVVSIKDFGAFIEVLPGQEGLCHVSELSDQHVREVSDVVKLGDRLPVKVLLRDEQGRLKLSHRAVLLDGPNGNGGPGAPRPDARPPVEESDGRPPRAPRGDDGDRPPRAPRGDDGDRPRRGPRAEEVDDRPRRGPRGDDGEDRPRRGPRVEVEDEDRPRRRPRSDDTDDLPVIRDDAPRSRGVRSEVEDVAPRRGAARATDDEERAPRRRGREAPRGGRRRR